MNQYIKNPKTGKDIIVGGPTYEKLLKSPYAAKVTSARPFYKEPVSEHQRYSGRTTKASTVKIPKSSVKPSGGRGGKTKGWKDAAPKRGAERSALKNKCGSECFLKPDNNGFPICAKLDGSKNDCKVDCRGIIASKVRSGQWDYKDVHEAAMMLGKKYGC